MNKMNTILKVNGLTKKYGSKTALNNVTFSVEKGKIYGFIDMEYGGSIIAQLMVRSTDFFCSSGLSSTWVH